MRFGSLSLVFHWSTNYRLVFPLHWCCRFWPQVRWSNHKWRGFSVDVSFNTCALFTRKNNPRSAPITNSGAFNRGHIFFVLIWPELALNSIYRANVLSIGKQHCSDQNMFKGKRRMSVCHLWFQAETDYSWFNKSEIKDLHSVGPQLMQCAVLWGPFLSLQKPLV